MSSIWSRSFDYLEPGQNGGSVSRRAMVPVINAANHDPSVTRTRTLFFFLLEFSRAIYVLLSGKSRSRGTAVLISAHTAPKLQWYQASAVILTVFLVSYTHDRLSESIAVTRTRTFFSAPHLQTTPCLKIVSRSGGDYCRQTLCYPPPTTPNYEIMKSAIRTVLRCGLPVQYGVFVFFPTYILRERSFFLLYFRERSMYALPCLEKVVPGQYGCYIDTLNPAHTAPKLQGCQTTTVILTAVFLVSYFYMHKYDNSLSESILFCRFVHSCASG